MSWLVCAALISATVRPTVAILPLWGEEGAAPWIGSALADDLNTRLLIHSRFEPKSMGRVYPINVFSWRQVLAAADGDSIDVSRPMGKKAIADLVAQLGTSHLFTGTYSVIGDSKVQVEWTLHGPGKPQGGRTELSLQEMSQGAEALFSALLLKLGEDPKGIGGHRLTPMPLPAVQAYGQGLELVRRQSLDPRARLILTKDQIVAARTFFTAAVEAEPTFVRAWVERGIASAMLGELAAAEGELVQAMAHAGEFEPAIALALYYLYDRQNKPAEALKTLEEATTTHLGFLHGLGYLGRAYSRAGDSYKALEVFTHYQSRVPESPWARVMHANALSNIGKHDQAIAESLAVAKDFPDSVMVLASLAGRQLDARKIGEAKATLDRALKMKPKSSQLLARRAQVELEGGSAKAAVTFAQQAVENLGENRGTELAGYAHSTLAHALVVSGATAPAYDALNKAVELGLSSEDRLVLVRDPRMREFLLSPRSPVKLEEGHMH